MGEPIKNRYEFVVLFDVENGNPNGDPDAGNMPRIDPESGLGLVTDVCLKRKIRNYVEMVKEDSKGYEIYIKEDVPLNRSDRKAYESIGIEETDDKKIKEAVKKLKKTDPDVDIKLRDYMCDNFYDIRTFGAVMTTFVKAALNCGQVRGPVQIGFARSIDPIISQEVTITRVAITTEKDAEKKNTEMGRKCIVPYGLYRAEGYISANLARKVTGFSEDDLELFCGCRTEVGVHAYAQIANFRTSCSVSTQNIKHYLNRYLPMDIAIIEVEEVPERFHAQLNATSKTYVYRMTIDDVPSVFDRKYTYHCYRIPDKRMMQQAAEKLTGRHDFRNFSSAKKTKSTVREIFDIDIYGDIEEMQILIHADDFLHNMARIIVGTLMDIGLGNRSVQDIDDIFAGILEASAPCDPKGLYLQEVTY